MALVAAVAGYPDHPALGRHRHSCGSHFSLMYRYTAFPLIVTQYKCWEHILRRGRARFASIPVLAFGIVI